MLLSPIEFMDSISGGGATGTGNCILNVSVGSADSDGTEYELGIVQFQAIALEKRYIIDLTFKDPIMKEKLYRQMESYGKRFTMRGGESDPDDQMFFQFAPDTEYWEQYILAMNPQFWALTLDDYYGEANTIRILFDESDVLFAGTDDIGDEEEGDTYDTWGSTSDMSDMYSPSDGFSGSRQEYSDFS